MTTPQPSEKDLSAAGRILPATRVLALVIVPFLVAAFVICYLMPTRTLELFAWGIKPPLTAMLLAAVYIGGAFFFVRVATARRWSEVALGFPPAAVFASLLGVTTVLHWDRFTHGHISFVAWAALYFAAPVVVVAIAAMNTRAARHTVVAPQPRLSSGVRLVLGVTGLAELGVATGLFVLPSRVGDLWPWAVTPLTARTLAAVYALGLANVLVAADGRASRVRLQLEVQAVMLSLIAIAVLVRRGDFTAGTAVAYPFAAVVAAELAVVTAGLIGISRSKAAAARPASPATDLDWPG
ncbi:hypothetical protein DMA12_35530 [Amycolatopsis balhimycina DSM 5908]|uniref:Uncharacterized protein n=1 Tax=Amycolatopsis balhimycina DSM 5908 TaxID=1081091 RepID=A0A428W409_AMYBA|nr:hypothetical protein [Amycolatopsis balhimycina]RSM37767.1 hypothetical protein DMA12_35530 [Amycolatopsis balhimycina DSM 5908]